MIIASGTIVMGAGAFSSGEMPRSVDIPLSNEETSMIDVDYEMRQNESAIDDERESNGKVVHRVEVGNPSETYTLTDVAITAADQQLPMEKLGTIPPGDADVVIFTDIHCMEPIAVHAEIEGVYVSKEVPIECP